MAWQHKASRRQEERAARVYGGTRNAASGAGDWRKNDVRTPTESWEMKTANRTYTLKADELERAHRNALLDGGRSMRFGIRLGGQDYVLMREEDYLELKAAAEEAAG